MGDGRPPCWTYHPAIWHLLGSRPGALIGYLFLFQLDNVYMVFLLFQLNIVTVFK